MSNPLENITLFAEGRDTFSLMRPPFDRSHVMFSGTCSVLLENGEAVLLSNLAMRDTSKPFKVRTPVGVREVSLIKGPYSDTVTSVSAVLTSGKLTSKMIYLDTDCKLIYVKKTENSIETMDICDGAKFEAFDRFDGRYIVEPMAPVVRKFPHYSYGLTTGPIYIGFSSSQIFLPLLVT